MTIIIIGKNDGDDRRLPKLHDDDGDGHRPKKTR
jgi:hypothetical protein